MSQIKEIVSRMNIEKFENLKIGAHGSDTARFFNVPVIDLSEIKSDFDILFLAFDDLMDKPWFLRAGFEALQVGGELAVQARKGHYDKLKVSNIKLIYTKACV